MAGTGKTPTGLTKDAGWEIGVSKTVPHPIEQVWDLLVSDEGAALWLGPGARVPDVAGETWNGSEASGQLRSRRPNDRIRTTFAPVNGGPESTVQVVVIPSAGGGTSLRFHQERLEATLQE